MFYGVEHFCIGMLFKLWNYTSISQQKIVKERFSYPRWINI